MAILSSPSLILLFSMVTLVEEAGSMPSVLGELEGELIVIPLIVAVLIFFRNRCIAPGFSSVTLLTVILLPFASSIRRGRLLAAAPEDHHRSEEHTSELQSRQ